MNAQMYLFPLLLIILICNIDICSSNVFPPRCPANETYKQCATACEPTCRNQQPACIAVCRPPACQCNRGYVSDCYLVLFIYYSFSFVRQNGKCIPPNECPNMNQNDEAGGK